MSKKKKEVERRPPVSPNEGAYLVVVSLFLSNIKMFAYSKGRIPPGEVVAVVIQAAVVAVETGWWSSSVQEGEGKGWEGVGFLEAESVFLEHHRGLQKCPGFWVKINRQKNH